MDEDVVIFFFFFFQAEDGIRDIGVTGVQTCALPILTLVVLGLAALAGGAALVSAGPTASASRQAEPNRGGSDRRADASPARRSRAPRTGERRVGEECRSRWAPVY